MFDNIKAIGEWKTYRNKFDKKSVIVIPRRLFKEVYDLLSDCDDIVFISIENIDNAIWAKTTYRPQMHLVPNAFNVLNLDFDDVEKTGYDDSNNLWKAMDEEDGIETARFIKQHFGKHFVIHCTAGKSRSQGVRRAIIDLFPETYGENEYTLINPCLTPNYAVVAAIKKPFWTKEVEI